MPVAKSGVKRPEKNFVKVQFRAIGKMKTILLELEERTGHTRAAIGREALYYYLTEKHGMK